MNVTFFKIKKSKQDHDICKIDTTYIINHVFKYLSYFLRNLEKYDMQ